MDNIRIKESKYKLIDKLGYFGYYKYKLKNKQEYKERKHYIKNTT